MRPALAQLLTSRILEPKARADKMVSQSGKNLARLGYGKWREEYKVAFRFDSAWAKGTRRYFVPGLYFHVLNNTHYTTKYVLV